MYCGKCGKEIEVTERFCRHCGAKNDYFKEKFRAEDIVQGIKDRNEKAIEEFYSLTYKQGFSVAIQIVKNEQDAMDLLQDAYLSALTKIEQLESSAKIKSWFNCIVANRCRDWLRKKKGHNTQLFAELKNDEYDEGVEDRFANENMQFSPDESVDYAETKRLMQEILDKLPEDQRLCVLMYYYEELSVGEIAQALECSTGTVKSRLNYARKKIKNEVEELERKGTKLYGIAPLPFIVWMLSLEEKTLEVKASGLEKWRQYAANSETKQIAVKNTKTGSDHITESEKAGAGHIAESAKTGAGHIAKRAMAGIVAAAVVGTGAYIGYTKYIAKPADTKQEQVKQENTAKQEKETIPEFTLTDEQKEQIQYAAGMFFRADMETELIYPSDDFTIQIKKEGSGELIKEVANSIAYKDYNVKSKKTKAQEANEDNNKKLLTLEECRTFMQDTFGLKLKKREDIEYIFEPSETAGKDVLEAVYQGESTNKYENEELCKMNRYVQTGKDEFHFYAKILDPEDNAGYTTAGTMEITAHKNDNSKIGGFVFDKIVYKAGKRDLVTNSIETSVVNMPRAKLETDGEDVYKPAGKYSVDEFTSDEFVGYANYYINGVDEIECDYSDEEETDILEENQYKNICEKTLGRTKKYTIDGVGNDYVGKNKVKKSKVWFHGFPGDLVYVINEMSSIESIDGTVKVTGVIEEVNIQKEYNFVAQGYKDNKSVTGVVIKNVEISNKN